MSRTDADGAGDDAYVRSEAAIAELLALRELWFQRFLTAQSARELSRARQGIARCESLIVRIETVHMRSRAALRAAMSEDAGSRPWRSVVHRERSLLDPG